MSAQSSANERVEHESPDLVAANIDRLKELFPEIVSDGKVDFETLRDLLGDEVDDTDEKFGLNWHGKRRARQLALTPSTGTLRPAPEESVDWETTKHLMIEGDNLEVLKLLQKSYAGRVKLIYIDPPYNTGNDFVYKDDFKDNIANYLEITGQAEGGSRVSTNTEASGRFHTDWLNMIYPRLYLARHLLRDDGVIAVSIGDQESSRLEQILSELFGEENLLGRFVWTYGLSANQGAISSAHEYVMVAAKSASSFDAFYLTEDDLARLGPEVSDATFRAVQPKNPVSELVVPSGIRSERGDSFTIPAGVLEFGRARLEFVDEAQFKEGRLVNPVRLRAAWTMKDQCIRWFKSFEEGEDIEVLDSKGQRLLEIYFANSGRLSYRKERSEQSKVSSHLSGDSLTYSRGRSSIEALFDGESPFDYPKPVALVSRLVELATSGGDVVMDFFAGSGTTAVSTFEVAATSGAPRRFILVQFPELINSESRTGKVADAICQKLGVPPFLTELTKERIRRAAGKIRSDRPGHEGDLGFRVFKLDSSNIRAWDPQPEDLENTLLDYVDHLKEDRSEQDVLYELLLKLGLDLCVPIETTTIANKTVHSIGAGTLFACLEEPIDADTAEDLALGIVNWRDKLDPAGDTTVVFLDSAFPDDVTKTNLDAILKQHNITTVRSI